MESKKRTKISVLMPVYNQEDKVARAIESILAQKGDIDYELVIVDDCSSDGTTDVCQEYSKRYPDRIKFTRNAVNKGVVRNYYDMALSAQGDYLADCAGDDEWIYPYKLEEESKILDKNQNVSIVHTDWHFRDEKTDERRTSNSDGRLDKYREPIVDGECLFMPMLQHFPGPIIHTCTFMYRKRDLQRLYNEDKKMFSSEWPCEDLQLVVGLSKLGDIAFIDKITLLYGINETSITGGDNAEKTFNFYCGSLRLTRYLQLKYKVSDKAMRPWYRKMHYYLLSQALITRKSENLEKLKEIRKEIALSLGWKDRAKYIYEKIFSF